MILYCIELAIVQTYQKNTDLTDRIVTNVLNELICCKEDRPYLLEYLKLKDEKIHRELCTKVGSAFHF